MSQLEQACIHALSPLFRKFIVQTLDHSEFLSCLEPDDQMRFFDDIGASLELFLRARGHAKICAHMTNRGKLRNRVCVRNAVQTAGNPNTWRCVKCLGKVGVLEKAISEIVPQARTRVIVGVNATTRP